MKRRDGFVSNSSSSSFICCVSGHVVSGMDMCLDESGMYNCVEQEHEFCTEFLVDGTSVVALKQEVRQDNSSVEDRWIIPDDADAAKRERYTRWNREAVEQRAELLTLLNEFPDDGSALDLLEELWGNHYEHNTVPAAMCPICSLQHIQDSDLLAWALANVGTDRKELTRHLQDRFSSQAELQADTKQLAARLQEATTNEG